MSTKESQIWCQMKGHLAAKAMLTDGALAAIVCSEWRHVVTY